MNDLDPPEPCGLAELWRLIMPVDEHGDVQARDELDELRDALDDAIRRAYCAPLEPLMEGEDPDVVREITTARILTNPAAMRQLVTIQRAAWAVIQERVDAR